MRLNSCQLKHCLTSNHFDHLVKNPCDQTMYRGGLHCPILPEAGRLIQVGAHDHRPGGHDRTPGLIRSGWSAVLVDAQQRAIEVLRGKYANLSDRVHVVHAAVCPNSSMTEVTFYQLDTSNRSHGSNHSDIRCLTHAMRTAVASINPHHITAFSRFKRQTASQCRSCAERLGRPLPDNCQRDVFKENLLALRVHPRREPGRGAVKGGSRSGEG